MLFTYSVTLCCNKVVHHCVGLVNYRVRQGSLMRSPANTPLQSQNILKFLRLTEFSQLNSHNIDLVNILKRNAAIPVLENILECPDYITFRHNADLVYTNPVIMEFLTVEHNKFCNKHRIIIYIIHLYRFKFIRYILYRITLFLNKWYYACLLWDILGNSVWMRYLRENYCPIMLMIKRYNFDHQF